MTAEITKHIWSREALFEKAFLFVGEMERFAANDWRFGLWSSLALEMLARATVAHISPTLLANPKNWRNAHFAIGYATTAKSFVPQSISVSEVLSILKELLPTFNKELHDFCAVHCARRNAELHSGDDAFTSYSNSAWLPKFYASCDVFLLSMGMNLGHFFNDPAGAQAMVDALRDTAAKAVEKEIEIHRQIWKDKSPEDQRILRTQAEVWASRHVGHRVICPACGSNALIRGSGQGPVTTELRDDEVVQSQTVFPSSFECIACGLKITGLSKLSACGLGDAFTVTSILSAAEFFDLHTDEELQEARGSAADPEPEFEDDMNEFGIDEEPI